MDRQRHVPAGALTADTAQSAGMRREEAVSAEGLWMGRTTVAPGTVSADHHHGESETAIYVVSGNPRFVFLDGASPTVVDTEPGDYVYVPPFVPHREENPSPDTDAVVVIARSTREAIVVNLP